MKSKKFKYDGRSRPVNDLYKKNFDEIFGVKKEEALQKRKKKPKPQFGLGQVPTYGKSRSGREYGGFIKESVRKKMEFKPTNRGRNINKKGPYEI